jgi:hypothetical protein
MSRLQTRVLQHQIVPGVACGRGSMASRLAAQARHPETEWMTSPRAAHNHSAMTPTLTTPTTPSIHQSTCAIAAADGPAGSSVDSGPVHPASSSSGGRHVACLRRR